MQVAILDDERLIAPEQVRILLLHPGEIIERLLLREGCRDLNPPRRAGLSLPACRAVALDARSERPFVLDRGAGQSRTRSEDKTKAEKTRDLHGAQFAPSRRPDKGAQSLQPEAIPNREPARGIQSSLPPLGRTRRLAAVGRGPGRHGRLGDG